MFKYIYIYIKGWKLATVQCSTFKIALKYQHIAPHTHLIVVLRYRKLCLIGIGLKFVLLEIGESCR
jgi:hypothetical protein